MDKPCGHSASIYSDSGAALSFFFPSKQLYLIDPLSVVPENSWIASFLYLISLPNLVGFLQHRSVSKVLVHVPSVRSNRGFYLILFPRV